MDELSQYQQETSPFSDRLIAATKKGVMHVSTSLLGEALVQTDFTVPLEVLGEGFSLSWQYLGRAPPTRNMVVFKSRMCTDP